MALFKPASPARVQFVTRIVRMVRPRAVQGSEGSVRATRRQLCSSARHVSHQCTTCAQRCRECIGRRSRACRQTPPVVHVISCGPVTNSIRKLVTACRLRSSGVRGRACRVWIYRAKVTTRVGARHNKSAAHITMRGLVCAELPDFCQSAADWRPGPVDITRHTDG